MASKYRRIYPRFWSDAKFAEVDMFRLMLWNSMSEEQKLAARADVFEKYELRGYDPKDELHDFVIAFLFFRMALTN